MKSTIILLATVAGIGIGATQASAGDAENLSCITEVDENGATVRDCERQQVYLAKAVSKKAAPAAGGPEAPIEPGHRGGDGRGGGRDSGGKGPND